MAQQTAVQWLKKEVQMNRFYTLKGRREAFEKALQMEKEQIRSAFEHGHSNGVDKTFCMDNPMLKNSEQYYNEKYNNIDDAH